MWSKTFDMKIYSKYKDYYDYCKSYLGEDPLVIYERHCDYELKFPRGIDMYIIDLELNRFFICGFVIDVLVDFNNQKLLIGGDIIDLSNSQKIAYKNKRTYYKTPNSSKKVVDLILSASKWDKIFSREYVLTEPVTFAEYKQIFINRFDSANRNPEQHSKYRDWNNIKDCPVVIVNERGAFRNPVLSDWKISGIIPAEEMYLKITNWLLERQNVEMVDNRSDVEKLVSHGFDKKTSFRH